tara:strand:+ start:1682 stop:3184 length:1503 start_codon:yes stop_codon:yes gene_type:complete
MKNYIAKAFIFIVVFAGFKSSSYLVAQQSPVSNFYNFNNYLLNPAEAGHYYRLAGTASHRIQWQGIDGAPRTTFFGVHGAINDKMGIGGQVVVDQTDILKQFNAALSYSYRIAIDDNTDLRFGVSGMMVQNSINFNNAIIGDFADEVATGGNQGGVTFDAEAGLMLSHKNGSIGIAASHLFENDVNYDLPSNRGDGTFERVRHFRVYGSYEFKLSDNWNLEPFVLARNQGVESFQIEVNALTSWKETLYMGIGYRQEAGYIGKVGFQITDQLMAAYAYEFSNTGIASNSNGSHEFMLGLRIGKAKRFEPLNPSEKNEVVDTAPQKNKEVTVVEEITIEKEVADLDTIVYELNKVEPTKNSEIDEEVIIPEVEVEVIPEVSKEVSKLDKTVFEQKIAFEFDQIDLSNESKSTLNQVAEELNKFPNQRILIKGHTCNMGNNRINKKVSTQRAEVIKAYLISKKVDKSKIEVKGMLDAEPLVPNTSLNNRKKNRRAEFELLSD